MSGKWIWIIIGLLAVVLIFMLFSQSGSGTRAAGGGTAGGGTFGTGGSNIGTMLEQLEASTTQPPSASDCRSSCRQICKVYPAKLTCKERCECKRDCKSACASGLDYRSMFP